MLATGKQMRLRDLHDHVTVSAKPSFSKDAFLGSVKTAMHKFGQETFCHDLPNSNELGEKYSKIRTENHTPDVYGSAIAELESRVDKLDRHIARVDSSRSNAANGMQIPEADLTELMDTLKQIRLEHEAEEAKLNDATSKQKKGRR